MEVSFLQGVVWVLIVPTIVLIWFLIEEVRIKEYEEPEEWVEGWDRIVNDSMRLYDWEQDGS